MGTRLPFTPADWPGMGTMQEPCERTLLVVFFPVLALLFGSLPGRLLAPKGIMNSDSPPSRDDLASQYFASLPFQPYPVQEEALLAWFTAEQGVLVCAPTGTGKTLIAEAALFEALHSGKTAYYTTPLIALTEQKFRELQQKVVGWGFQATDVGLVTGNRSENPNARILVVVAEILLNRLLAGSAFDFSNVESVVMDEFHSFNDPDRGIVWELSLGLLPRQVRTLLISATVGNAYPFSRWLARNHDRDLQLVESTDRKVPLNFHWIGDQLLNEQLTFMASGEETSRYTPALVFCFNREECWTVAEQLKGKDLIDKPRQSQLVEELAVYDWSQGVGPKLRQILLRGVGVHHAGVLPRYRRIVEDLFQRKLLTVTVCTETLAAGVNLPARSVVLPTIMKGPFDKKKLIDPSSAHQMFGRAGRPQFDDQGHVFVLASEDDVKLTRWQEKYDQIPEDTKDPGLRRAKKGLKKKKPKRRANFVYWTEAQFEKLRDAPPEDLASRGALPWRWLAYLLEYSADLAPVREMVSRRLLSPEAVVSAQKELDRMLLTLWRAGYVQLQPRPPVEEDDDASASRPGDAPPEPSADAPTQLFGFSLGDAEAKPAGEQATGKGGSSGPAGKDTAPEKPDKPRYQAVRAVPTEALFRLGQFRSVNPLYGAFLIGHLGIANRAERIQALESVLEMPGSVARHLRVPTQDALPNGPLATDRLDEQMLRWGLATAEELHPDPDERREWDPHEPPPPPLTLARKLRILFDHDFPHVERLRTQSVWCAGELLAFGGNFNGFVLSRKLQKQEGIVFRHLLRLVLLISEFERMCPPDTTEDEWRGDLGEIRDQLADACRTADAQTTERTLAEVLGDSAGSPRANQANSQD